MDQGPFIPLDAYRPAGSPESVSAGFYEVVRRRRTVRHYATRPVSLETVKNLVRAAGTAPSGANKQPWRFVCISDPAEKARLRAAAEKEEHEFYTRLAPPDWLRDLHPLGTSENKAFLEEAPWLIVVFRLVRSDDGSKVYYSHESVGLAVGLLLVAAHHAGLSTLTYTPSRMGFLSEILKRPIHERPYLVVALGFPAEGCLVPKIDRKPLDRIMVVHEAHPPAP
jgi:nitroreductase